MKDLTQGSELKTILYFSLPILVGNLFQQLYNVADSVIVGNFLGKESLAAVGFSYQINFLLIALVVFCIVKLLNAAKDKVIKKPEEEPKAPTTRTCPYCMSVIDIKATRCPHCTSELEPEGARG